MREIKFRAWEKSLQEIIPVYDIDFSCRQINTNGAWRLFNELELMQYTGLKDMNGKEIYDGDIVKQFCDASIVQGCIGGFDLKMIRGVHEGSTFTFSFLLSEQCEVIGNIYENPELLGKTP